ncbi:sigma-54-dependent Fis family transcriptional regulator [Virgibacillus dokdonensis]|uniref:Sigma-54-dependent Fis family transcriptional regulator n=1 Tax=Virgibacillus dokdonensis TaxID=302167 RepID=A0ABU7VK05_9BACI
MITDVVTKENWKRFIHEGSLVDENISYELVDSWERCKQEGVDPFDGISKSILQPDELQRRVEQNELLISLVEAQRNQLHYFLKGWQYVTTLTDKEGYILQNRGEQSVEAKAYDILFIQGSNWGETEVGTNAIGLAQLYKKPFTVKGYGHFAVASQMWNCAAAPIVDHHNQLIGILNISSPYKPINFNYVLASVKMIADSISLAWRKTMYEDMEQLQKLSCSKNAIICSNDDVICKLPSHLENKYGYMLGEPLDNIMPEISLHGERKPLLINGRSIGYEVYVQEEIKENPVYFAGVTGKSDVFQKVLQDIHKVATTDAAVHIYGETGTGKELVAEAIHRNSERAHQPFVSINCGAIPEQLLESELFGYEPGAFTGAHKNGRKGKLEAANKGTLFLDEIGDMPSSMQISLLRVLQQKQVTRIGGYEPIPIDVRIISATNVDIRQLVAEETMRADLFYRIYGFPIYVPALRQRKEDIPYFIDYYCKENHWYPSWINKLTAIFKHGRWGGNIRELFNALDRCRILFPEQTPEEEELYQIISIWDNTEQISVESNEKETQNFRNQLEVDKIKQALKKHHNHVPSAAADLNMSRSTLYRKIKKYQL